MLSRKAQGTGPRKPISLLLGLGFIVLGLLPILKSFGILGFTIGPLPSIVIWALLVVGGVFLAFDGIAENMSFMGLSQMLRNMTFLFALLALALGLIPLLNSLGVVGFTLPGILSTVNDYLFTIVGFLLIYGGTQGF